MTREEVIKSTKRIVRVLQKGKRENEETSRNITWYSNCACAVTVQLDGDLLEWTGDDVTAFETVKTDKYGEYTLYQTNEGDDLYYSLERSQINKRDSREVMMIAIDVDGIAGSGSDKDYYNGINFTGTFRPDFILYAGIDGGDTFNYAVWNNGSWILYPGAKITYESNTTGIAIASSALAGEYAINLGDLGFESTANAHTWAALLASAKSAAINVSWDISSDGTAGDGLVQVPEPASLALLGIGGLLIRRKRG